ncbi:MAG TPA: hypothetical protein VNO18_07030, partial [Xanthobacteraceae bacterium]|nr:hypothetical protein [Xanthobacteraceae bacterium]
IGMAVRAFTEGGGTAVGLDLAGHRRQSDHTGIAGKKSFIMDKHRRLTPTLRSVALHAPYMHNASVATLADVVRHYEKSASIAQAARPCCIRSN